MHRKEEGRSGAASVRSRLDRDYRATTYRALIPGEPALDLRVGALSAALDALLARNGANDWAFVTAWNPGSRPLSGEENAARHAELLQAVEAGGWRCFEAAGIPARRGWSPEASLLVLGITRQQAVALGKRFGQNAIVAGQRGGAAELIYCG